MMLPGRRPMVRRVETADVSDMLALVGDYFDFYAMTRPEAAHIRRFIMLLMLRREAGAQFIARLEDGRPVGFATLFVTYDTLTVGQIVTLNDIYVVPEYRRLGVGRALLESSRGYCRDHGFTRLEWVTAPDNAAAQGFYESMGATKRRWVAYDMSPS